MQHIEHYRHQIPTGRKETMVVTIININKKEPKGRKTSNELILIQLIFKKFKSYLRKEAVSVLMRDGRGIA